MTTDHAQLRPYDRHPAFEGCPSALDIAHWFVEEMRGVGNVGGDAWWLSRNPHGSCRMLAFVDYDTQEFYLLDITTEDSSDLLLVSCGLDGLWCDWWQHPTEDADHYWYRDGIEWMADQIVLHLESNLHGQSQRSVSSEPPTPDGGSNGPRAPEDRGA